MYGEDTTAEDLVDAPHVAIKWNGVTYNLEINSDDTITFHPRSELDEEEGEETTLTFEEVTENLQNEDMPFNTYR